MRILTGIDVPFAPFGGSPLVCNDWYSALPPDVEVRFLTLPPPEGTSRWWTMRDVRFLEARKARTPDGFSAYVDALRAEVARHVADFRPTLLHCQHLNFGLSRALADAAPGVPRVGISHGTDVQAALESPFFRDNLRAIRERMDALLFPAPGMAEDYFAVDPCDVPYTVLSHGIPDRLYRPRPAGPPRPSGLRVLYAGRLTPWKGADIAVEALGHLPADVHLDVVGGEDSPGYLRRLEETCAAKGLEGRVRFEGHLSREALLERFDAFDAIVFPSRQEAFGLTSIEAQARGLVVVYASTGRGLADAVGDSGLRVEENTPEGFAAALGQLRAAPRLLEEYRARGYRNAERYRMSTIRPRFLALAREHARGGARA